MNYELAKQLKDAGFPQGYPRFYKDGSLFNQVYWEHPANSGVWKEEIEKTVSYPTLSELIEAAINSGGYTGFGLNWIREEKSWAAGLKSLVDNPIALGSTPEEAVAKLWLELQK